MRTTIRGPEEQDVNMFIVNSIVDKEQFMVAWRADVRIIFAQPLSLSPLPGKISR